MTTVKQAYAFIDDGRTPHDCFLRGVKQYMLEILKKLMDGDSEGVDGDTPLKNLNLLHVTHHCDGDKYLISDRTKDAKEIVRRACYGAMFLVSNEDIANRLYTKAQKANRRMYENAMERQIEAVWTALGNLADMRYLDVVSGSPIVQAKLKELA